MNRLTLISAASLLLVAACASTSPHADQKAVESISDIQGQWAIASLSKNKWSNRSQRPATISFDQGNINFSLGCNSHGLTMATLDNGTLRASARGGIQTATSCGSKQLEQAEDDLLENLVIGMNVYAFENGTFLVTSQDFELLLTKANE